MTDEPRWLRKRPGALTRRITRLLARAWPEDDADRRLAAMTPKAIAKGNGHLIEQARYALDRESAKAVLDRAFMLGNLAAGCILTTIILGGGALQGDLPVEGFAISAVQGPGVWLATLETGRARHVGRAALLTGTGIGIGLL